LFTYFCLETAHPPPFTFGCRSHTNRPEDDRANRGKPYQTGNVLPSPLLVELESLPPVELELADVDALVLCHTSNFG
jgi:hypothetical protein